MAITSTVYSSISLTVNALGADQHMVARLTIDCPGKTNVLSSATMEELGSAAVDIANDAQIKAVILLSAKPNMFAVGADLREILEFETQDQAYQMVKRGQEVFARFARLKIPVIAAIHGLCLGGGLEFALCAHRRIATNCDTSLLGLPEVTLGLLPGLGGTQRLPRLIGLKPGLDMILSGKPIQTKEAYELGLVDEIVELSKLESRTEEVALELIELSEFRKPDSLANGDDKSKSVLATSQRAIRIRTKGNYPAFTKAIEVIAESINNGIEAGLEAEAKAFSELAPSDTAHNLINLFFAQELAIRSGSKKEQADETDLGDVGIVGTGMMGSGIAYLSASNGYRTHLVETDSTRLAAALESISKKLPAPVQGAQALESLGSAQVVIEAIPEDLQTKIAVFQKLEKIVSADCLLASNTSCLSVTNIGNSLAHSNRFLGMHFFHPVERMPLVEVIVHPDTGKQSIDEAAALAVKLGKVPVLVNDGPGFLVNRVLCPYLIESALLAEQGVPMSWIEEAAISFGMPMGPFALMDEIGLDISFKVAKLLHESFDGRLPLPGLMHKMETLGLLGKRNNAGFYSWNESGSGKEFNSQLIEFAQLKTSTEKLPENKSLSLQQRLILPMIDEATRCLLERVVRKPRQVDLAMVLGTGFPGFRGGPLRYADSLGISRVVELLEEMYAARKQQQTIHACELLTSMAAGGKQFY